MEVRKNETTHKRGRWHRKGVSSVLCLSAATLGLAFGTAGAVSASPKPKAETFNITIGFPVANINLVPIWVGIDNGIFAKYGLNVKTVTLNNSAAVAVAQTSNSITVGLITPIGIIPAYAGGAPVEAISEYNNGLPGALVVSDSYMASHGLTKSSSAATVAKALVGSNEIASSLSVIGQAAVILRSFGVQESQYKSALVTSTSAEVTALQRGQGDWFFANYPTPLLPQNEGFGTVLLNHKNTPVLAAKQINQVLMANTSFAAGHPALMKKIVKAISTSVVYVAHHEQKCLTIATQNLPGYTRANLLQSLQAVQWSTGPAMNENIWRDSVAFDVKSGQIALGTHVQENAIWTNAYA